MSEIKSLMEEVSKILPETEDDNLNDLKIYLYNGNVNDPAYQYICSKIPEFFLRGSKVLSPFYHFCVDNREEKKPHDALLLRMKNGDFSDLKQMEDNYPYLVKLSKFLPEKTIWKTKEIIHKMLWECGEVIPFNWRREYEKYKDVYDDIIKDGGYFFLDNQYMDNAAIDKRIESHPEEKEKLEFAKRIMKAYE